MSTARPDPILRYVRKLAASCDMQERSDQELLHAFAAHHQETAFSTLVARHGPMVLRVCRRVLGHEQDAEDAFQATFLVLAINGKAIRKPDALADWLHGVAYRTAMNAKRSAARRRTREARLPPEQSPSTAPTWTEIQPALDEELRRLSEPLRLAFVLCVLEGKSESEAASLMGCKRGTVSSRLTRARQLLQKRLTRRGIHLGTLLAALAVSEGAPQALAAGLTGSTIKYGMLGTAGASAASQIPLSIRTLAQGVSGVMFSAKTKLAAITFLAAGLLAAGAGVMARHDFALPGWPVEKGNRSVKAQKDTVEVTGRVLDTEGKPFPGAKVFFARSFVGIPDMKPKTVASDTEGRFSLQVARTDLRDVTEKAPMRRDAVVAFGRGYAAGWACVSLDKLTNITIRLAPEVPVQGRVVDLQGKPVAGASIQVQSISFRADGGDLKGFVEALERREPARPYFPGTMVDAAALGQTRVETTGADGRFRLTGISGECVVGLRFSGPTIETAEVCVLTRPARTVAVQWEKGLPQHIGDVIFHDNPFEHVASPTRAITGVVRDKATGKPLERVRIYTNVSSPMGAPPHVIPIDSWTDAQGRYEIKGLSPKAGQELDALPAQSNLPYLRAMRKTGNPEGLNPAKVDFDLVRGVEIRGRVVDKRTRKPVRAEVVYFAFLDNPHLSELPRGERFTSPQFTGGDGSFTVLGLPGHGLVAAKAMGQEAVSYVTGLGADKIQAPLHNDCYITAPFTSGPSGYNALIEVNPASGTDIIVCDFTLDPGRTVTGIITDPDGKPLARASIERASGIPFQKIALPAAQFHIAGVDPQHPRAFFFRHAGRNLGAAVLLKGDEPMPVTIRLRKCAIISGRLVSEDGLPKAGFIAGFLHEGQLGNKGNIMPYRGEAKKDGRFRIDGVIPGLKMKLMAGTTPYAFLYDLVPELNLEPGEARELGDLRPKLSE